MLDTPPVPRPTCFVLGDLSRPEFRLAREWLRAQAQPVYCAGNAPDPLGGWIADTDPDVVIIVQTRPGEHRPTLVDRLRRRFPLTPLVVLTGSWCEGETRSGHPLAAAWRIPWYDFEPRMSWAWQDVPAGHPSRLHRPLLISDEDRWYQDLQCDETLRGFRVGIVAAAQAQFESLRDTLVSLGLPVTRSTARDRIRVRRDAASAGPPLGRRGGPPDERSGDRRHDRGPFTNDSRPGTADVSPRANGRTALRGWYPRRDAQAISRGRSPLAPAAIGCGNRRFPGSARHAAVTHQAGSRIARGTRHRRNQWFAAPLPALLLYCCRAQLANSPATW